MRKRHFWRVILLLLISFLLLVILAVCERVRGRISLARYKRELIAKGEKLTPGDMISPPSNGENGAPQIMAYITNQLKEGVVLPNRFPPAMKLTPAGHAIVCFLENEWVEDKVTNHWDQLSADLEANRLILDQIRAALEMPVLDNGLDFAQGFKLSFLHLAPAKS